MARKSKYSNTEKIKLVEEFLDGSRSMNSFAKAKGVNRSTLGNWIMNYQSMGPSGLDGAKYLHYPQSIKQAAVREYLAGKGSYRDLCTKFKIKSSRQLQLWVLKYNSHEQSKSYVKGRRRIMANGRKTTLQERIDIVRDHMQSGSSYEQTAEKYQISYQQVYQWVRKYRKDGIDGLVDRRGKRKEADKMTEEEKLRAELKLEKVKNRRLELENLFLKKLEEIERRNY